MREKKNSEASAPSSDLENWLFSQTINGADASCFFYSVIESAKANGLKPRDYLEFILTFGPVSKTDEELEALLPWNADLSRIKDIQEARKHAEPDTQRKTPYIFSGASR